MEAFLRKTRFLITESGRFVYEHHLLKNLLHCITDEVDFIREKALKLNQECIERFTPISTDTVSRVVEVLLGRLNAIPYPESSEEVRLQIISHLRSLLKDYKDAFRSCMGTVLDVLGKALLDKYPEVKRETSELICEFCLKMPDHISLNGKTLVKALATNTKHQHTKIRKTTIVVSFFQQTGAY
jgi:dynein assembly factor 5